MHLTTIPSQQLTRVNLTCSTCSVSAPAVHFWPCTLAWKLQDHFLTAALNVWAAGSAFRRSFYTRSRTCPQGLHQPQHPCMLPSSTVPFDTDDEHAVQAYSYYFSRDNVGLPGVALYFKVLTQVELAEGWAGIEVGCPLAVPCSMLNAICPPVCLQLLPLLLKHQACQRAQRLPSSAIALRKCFFLYYSFFLYCHESLLLLMVLSQSFACAAAMLAPNPAAPTCKGAVSACCLSWPSRVSATLTGWLCPKPRACSACSSWPSGTI